MNPDPLLIEPGSWWRYRGVGEGWGGTHMVTAAANDLIATWSIPQGHLGFAWLGTHADFEKDFIPNYE